MEYNILAELLKKRRTIRRFKPDPIPDEYVEKSSKRPGGPPPDLTCSHGNLLSLKRRKLGKKSSTLLKTTRPSITQRWNHGGNHGKWTVQDANQTPE